MEYKPFKPTGGSKKKVLFIAIASILLVGIIGYGTVTLLRLLRAPTLSGTTTSSQSTTPTQNPTVSPEKASQIADTAYAAAAKKVEEGDQKAALAEYKVAFENYKIANNTQRADDTAFIIQSIEAVLKVPENPAKPAGSKTSSKE
jgi:hypothetical protein